MEQSKEPIVASFDFGAYGKIELTKTKLIGSVISAQTAAGRQSSGRQSSLKGVKSEFRAKLDQVQNFEIQPPKSFVMKILWLLFIGATVGILPILGSCVGLGCAAGWLIGSSIDAIIVGGVVGGLVGIVALIWFAVLLWRSAGRAYLVFNVNGTDMNARCDGKRLPELQEFVSIVKKTQAEYLDSI